VAKDIATDLARRLQERCNASGREYVDPIFWLYDFATGVIGEDLEMTPGVTKVFPAKTGERLKAMTAIAEYLYPKQKSVEVTAEDLIRQIVTIAKEDTLI